MNDFFGKDQKFETFEDAMKIKNKSKPSEKANFLKLIPQQEAEQMYLQYVKDANCQTL